MNAGLILLKQQEQYSAVSLFIMPFLYISHAETAQEGYPNNSPDIMQYEASADIRRSLVMGNMI